jgi:hypothetical protein
MNRYEKRKTKRMLDNVAIKAKKDMGIWLDALASNPTVEEMKAWKAGYIAGINRVNASSINE